jgi:hypothetical protein
MCLRCLKATLAEKARDTRDRSRETFIDACETCKKTTLHLGPSWCTDCYAATDNTFPVYCEECVVQNDVPHVVRDDKGGVVDMLKVSSLWCLQCRGPADSWARLDA